MVVAIHLAWMSLAVGARVQVEERPCSWGPGRWSAARFARQGLVVVAWLVVVVGVARVGVVELAGAAPVLLLSLVLPALDVRVLGTVPCERQTVA